MLNEQFQISGDMQNWRMGSCGDLSGQDAAELQGILPGDYYFQSRFTFKFPFASISHLVLVTCSNFFYVHTVFQGCQRIDDFLR